MHGYPEHSTYSKTLMHGAKGNQEPDDSEEMRPEKWVE